MSHGADFVDSPGPKAVRETWPPLVDEKLWRAAQTVINAPHRLRAVWTGDPFLCS
jgi:hypothetical protein